MYYVPKGTQNRIQLFYEGKIFEWLLNSPHGTKVFVHVLITKINSRDISKARSRFGTSGLILPFLDLKPP